VTPIAAFSTWQLLILLFILLLLFGSKLPRLARSLGEGITEFKKGLNKGSEGDSDLDDVKDPTKRLPTDPETARRERKPTGIDDTSV
jgi:sec-independent protein translocase protein TatA